MDAEELAHVLERHGPGTRNPGAHSLPEDETWTPDRIERVVESLVRSPSRFLPLRRIDEQAVQLFGVRCEILFRVILVHRFREAWGIGTVHPINGVGVMYTNESGRSRLVGPLDVRAVRAYRDSHG